MEVYFGEYWSRFGSNLGKISNGIFGRFLVYIDIDWGNRIWKIFINFDIIYFFIYPIILFFLNKHIFYMNNNYFAKKNLKLNIFLLDSILLEFIPQ